MLSLFHPFVLKPFVEIQQEDGSYKTKNVEIGISDGINVEILEGVTENDKIKVWNIITDDSDIDDDERGEIDD